MASAARVAILIDDPLDPDSLPDARLLSALFGLTAAEAAIARLIPRTQSRRAMAEVLGVSENTVKTHLASIRHKLGAPNMAALVQMLVRATVAPSAGRRNG